MTCAVCFLSWLGAPNSIVSDESAPVCPSNFGGLSDYGSGLLPARRNSKSGIVASSFPTYHLALGAGFVLLGRAFMYGVAALGEAGGDHAVDLLITDLQSNMLNMGCANLSDLPSRLA